MDNEIDYNLPIRSNCKYFTVNEVRNLKNKNNFNIFHCNINGLDSTFDDLYDFISSTSSTFGVIAITETSQKNNEYFKTNVSIEGYQEFYSPSNSSKGGTALYVKDCYDVFERSDLKIQNDCFESVWVEIKNKRNKNILCGCIYRHPKYDLSEFMIYLETSLKKVVNENKEVYICGDFNIDLLKVEEKTITSFIIT